MTQPVYRVGIDLGTTLTVASVCRAAASVEAGTPATAAAVASVVFLAPDGLLLIGEAARRRALAEPGRVLREFKRRIGDATPLSVGDTLLPAEVVAARFVARVVAEVAGREGGPPSAVTVTHPVRWGEHQRQAFAAALADQGLADVLFLPEPQAAAIGYASAERVGPGHTVGVYDLGGGRFDAAVVRREADGSFALLGRPTGLGLGGVDFDDAVFAHVREAVGEAWDALDPDDPDVRTAVAGLRRACTAAKETLSADTEATIPVLLPGLHTTVRVGRAELEDRIRPAVVETVEALRRAFASAGVVPDTVLLVGGSSRIPLVAQLVSAELGRPVAVDVDPKAVVAAGAALFTPGPVAGSEPAAAGTADADHGSERPQLVPAPPPSGFDAPPARTVSARIPPRRGVVVAVGLAVATMLGVSTTVAARMGPVTAPVETAARLPGAVDPWTGATTDAATPEGAEGETTLPGPVRELAVAAAYRPAARNVPTGAVGASAVGVVGTTTAGTAGATRRRQASAGGGTTGSSSGGSGGATGGSTGGTTGGTTGGGTTTGGTTTGGTTTGGTGGTTTGGTTTGGGGATTTGGTSTGGGTTAGGGTSTGGSSTGGTTGGDTGSTGTGGDTGGTGGPTTGGTTGGSDSGGGDSGGGDSGGGDPGGSDSGGSGSGGGDSGGGGSSTGDGTSGGSDPT